NGVRVGKAGDFPPDRQGANDFQDFLVLALNHPHPQIDDLLARQPAPERLIQQVNVLVNSEQAELQLFIRRQTRLVAAAHKALDQAPVGVTAPGEFLPRPVNVELHHHTAEVEDDPLNVIPHKTFYV